MRFYVIGIDDNSKQSFSPEVESIILSSRVFSGGVRHHQIVADILPKEYKWIDIRPPMGALFELYRSHDEIVVFASGDPLFFGFAQTIQRLMPQAEIITYPHFNSLQQLAHQLTLPYQEMVTVSLTGRDWDKFDSALISGHQMVGLLTDNRDHTPKKIAQRMIDYGYTNYTISVGELLGNPTCENVSVLSVSEVASKEFEYPNNMILTQIDRRKRPFGIPDSEFTLLNGREKMITKRAIRLMSLSLLDLHNCKSMWDIGFCTGSVSVEAKLQFPHLKINSFEIREGCDTIIEENMRKFGTPGITYTIGDFCQADLSAVTPPDAIFIGGHGGKLKEIISIAYPKLSHGGSIVFNSVSTDSYNLFLEAISHYNLIVDQTSIEVDNFNKITIFRATKLES